MFDHGRNFNVDPSDPTQQAVREGKVARVAKRLFEEVRWHLYDKPALDAHLARTMTPAYVPESAITEVYEDPEQAERDAAHEGLRELLGDISLADHAPYDEQYMINEPPRQPRLEDGMMLLSFEPDAYDPMAVAVDATTGQIYIDAQLIDPNDFV